MTQPDKAWSGDNETRTLGESTTGTRRPKLHVFSGMDTTAKPKSLAPWTGDAKTRARTSETASAATPTPASGSAARTTRITTLISPDGRRGPLSGAVWPDYELGDLLGQGGMGAVYRARQISVDRLVALKVLPVHLAGDADLRRRFEIEARASSTLASPHIVQVYHAGIHDGQLYFAMEFVAGQSLAELAKARRAAGTWFALTETLGYIAQVAEGLRVAGAAGVVHRDIKPANCMVDEQGQLKLADFGIAKILGEDGGTLTGTAMGTPSYLSPEQARGDDIDQRADLYSLGIMLYELATGRLPYIGGSPDALIYQHSFTEPPLPKSLNKDISSDLQAVILKLIQKAPAARYPDAGALLTDLGRITGGMAPEVAVFVGRKLGTGADAALARIGGWRRRAWIAAAAVVVSAAALGGGWWWWDARKMSFDQAARLRDSLAVLDRQEPVPTGIGDELARLAHLVGEADGDVQRWRADLARVGQQQDGLQRFATLAEPGHAELQETTVVLAAYERETGARDGLARQVRQRLDETVAERESLRRQLAELDTHDVVPAARAVALAGPLVRLRRLSAAGDEDCLRWEAALRRSDATVAELRAALVSLDRTPPPPTVLAAVAGRLERLRILAGGEDVEVLRWQRILESVRSRQGTLRARLARLDDGALPGADLVAATAADLVAWQALAEAGDPELARWRARLAAADESRARLAAELEAVCATPIAADRLDAVGRDVDEYRRLAGVGDAAGRLWAQAVSAARDRLAGQRAVLAQLEQRPGELTVEEQRLARVALDGLRAAGALDQPIDERWRLRLMRDEAQLKLLAGNLAVLEQAVDPPAQAAQWLGRYESLAGADDAKARLWRQRLDRVGFLRSRLAPLDQQLPVPAGAAADVDSLQALVGAGDPRLTVWRGKLARCAALVASLAALDRPSPPPADAATQLAAYEREVGSEAPDARRWHARLDRIASLETRLEGLRERLLPDPEAIEAVDALAKLVGEATTVIAARRRLAELAGPPRQAWASDDGIDERGRWAEAVLVGQRVRLRWIPPATVRLGSPPGESGRDDDETQVQVELTRGFWLADGETTQAQWSAWMGGSPSWFIGSDRPVERVSWSDAVACCARLAEAVGAAIRLPSEAEWELACRAGTAGSFGAGTLERAAVYDRPADAGTDPVRRRLPNALGLMDMHGNVWEWCADAYAPYPGRPSPDHRADGGAKRVVRGGSWKDAPERLRSANRQGLDPAVRSACVGVRIVIGQEPWEGVR
jgi:hypothetical protein